MQDFQAKIAGIDDALLHFVEESFKVIANTEQALHKLELLKVLTIREKLVSCVNSKYFLIFANYGRDIEEVRRLYEAHKHAPPISRDRTPVAGNIGWSRQLLRRIELPMKMFKSHPSILRSPGAQKIVRAYNKLATTLMEFEALWHRGWCDSVPSMCAGLHETLLVKHPKTGKVYVNFDPQVVQLIREVKAVQRLELDVPAAAVAVCMQESKFKTHQQQLGLLLVERERVLGMISSNLSHILRAHVARLGQAVLPGLTTLTWKSLNIDMYIEACRVALHDLHNLVSKVNDTVECRISESLKQLSDVCLVALPEQGTWTPREFKNNMFVQLEDAKKIMNTRNHGVELAVADLVHMILHGLSEEETKMVEKDIRFVVRYFELKAYDAVVKCLTHWLGVLKRRLGARFSAFALSGVFHMDRHGVDKPFFSVSVELKERKVELFPPLEEIQSVLNQALVHILETTKYVYKWALEGEEDPEGGDQSLYTTVCCNHDVVKKVLALSGVIEGLRRLILDHLGSFHQYKFLWHDSKEKTIEAFSEKMSTSDGRTRLTLFEWEIRRYEQYEASIRTIPSSHVVGALDLTSSALRESLLDECTQWKMAYAHALRSQAHGVMESLYAFSDEVSTQLQREVKDLDDVRHVMGALSSLRTREIEMELNIAPVEESYAILQKYGASVDREELEMVDGLRYSWRKLKQQSGKVQDNLTMMQEGLHEELIHQVEAFRADVEQFAHEYETRGPMEKGIAPRVAVERLRAFSRGFEERERKWAIYRAGESLFGMPETEYPVLVRIQKELRLLHQLYDLYIDVLGVARGFKEILWAEVNVEGLQEQMDLFQRRCRALPSDMKEWDAFVELNQNINNMVETLPLLESLRHPAVVERHWEAISEITQHEFHMNPDTFKLQHLLDAPLLKHLDEIEEVCFAAVKECEIERKLNSIANEWASCTFLFAEFKHRGLLLLQGKHTAEVVTSLEDSLMTLGGLLSSRFNAPVRKQLQSWVAKLSMASEVIEQWLQVQSLWMYLEAVFVGGDIARQLPREAKRFSNVDKSWAKIMGRAVENPNVVHCTYVDETLHNLLPHMTEQLELCQKSLSGYLETKRRIFPRFYFVSDPALLEILSQGSNSHKIQPHLLSVFDNVAEVIFHESKYDVIRGLVSSEGEEVTLAKPMACEGKVEDWLGTLVRSMQSTVKKIIRQSIGMMGNLQLEDFIEAFPAQVVLLGLQMMWTRDCEEALSLARSEKGIMHATSKRIAEMTRELISLTTREITGYERTKVETLVTVQVHQRDVFEGLMLARIRSANDFEWLKQTRFYWQRDLDHAMVSITNVDFVYCNEYLGCQERLVITPLTDRCYVTLAQAIGMSLGGSPLGPAGTGKVGGFFLLVGMMCSVQTETVKDMARSLGKYVVVFNCSDQMNYSGLGKIFKGLASDGCWGCFDEFNRIELPVLSVAAQQIQCILTARREVRKDFTFTDGTRVKLNSEVGIFITMNPGYAGRQELPENLKLQFRAVAMMVPDREIIMRVKLASQGFQSNEMLAKKFFVLYRLCEEQLSSQHHYDWGLRNILSVLRTCGFVKRSPEYGDEDESMILLRVCRDMNLSKLVGPDEPLFLSLLQGLLPGKEVKKAVYEDLERAIAGYCEQSNLINHPSWNLKIIQLYETSKVRHGIMVLGPSGSGKTSCIKSLLAALNEIGQPHKEIRMNPKAITAAQMFGKMDPATSDWTDGIFSAIWRRQTKVVEEETWITLDGPVDTMWIESLNTVLDDNRSLTLANGDRIPMSDRLKLIFEVSSLDNASPATVSRAGMIYLSDDSLGWEPVFLQWQQLQAPSVVQVTDAIFEVVFQNIFTWRRDNAKEGMDLPLMSQVTTVVTLMSSLLELAQKEATDTGGMGERGKSVVGFPLSMRLSNSGGSMLNLFAQPVEESSKAPSLRLRPKHIARLFTYAVCWGLGGLLELEDRHRLSSFLVEREDFLGLALPIMEGHECVFDFFVDKRGEWRSWTERVMPFDYPQDHVPEFSSILVPTVEHVQMTELLKLITQQQRSVMLTGGSGTAKTSTIRAFASKLDSEETLFKMVNFSSATTPLMFQRTVESLVDKKMGNTYGPPARKNMFVFIDDINMPLINTWGDQETNELVRQLIECSGFYNLQKPGEVMNIVDLAYLAAMPTPGGGRNDVSMRLKRHFSVFNCTLPRGESIERIYSTILTGHLSPARKFAASLREIAPRLVRVTRRLWESVRKTMLPTPAKFHYVFNMRDMSRVVQGLMQCSPEAIQSDSEFAVLWRHEIDRVFPDRFVLEEDREAFHGKVSHFLKEEFGEAMAESLQSQPMYFAEFVHDPVFPELGAEDDPLTEVDAIRVYERVPSLDELRTRLYRHQAEYSQGRNRHLDLVLFDVAIVHLMRISRLIRLPQLHALLVGVGGSGKKSLTRLAAYLAGANVFQLTQHRHYNVIHLVEDLKALYKIAGGDGKNVVFVFSDADVKDESFLEYINSMLTSGEVSNLFPRDEMDMILSGLVAEHKVEHPRVPITNDRLLEYFLERVRKHLTVVLCFSPVGGRLRTWSLKFPGLISGCTIDWFEPWPCEALEAVATKIMSNIDLDCETHTRAALVKHVAFVHSSVSALSKAYLDKFRRHADVTPRSYLSFLEFYERFYSQKLMDINDQADRMQRGLKKLEEAGESVSKLRKELVQKEADLHVAQKASSEYLKVITAATSEAEAKRTEMAAVRETLAGVAAQIEKNHAEAEADLMAARPLLEEAKEALQSIRPQDVASLRKLGRPPHLIQRILDGVLILRNMPVLPVAMDREEYAEKGEMFYQPSFHEHAVPMLQHNFLKSLLEFPKDNITDEQCELLQPYLNMHDFNIKSALRVSKDVGGLCSWVRAMVFYRKISKVVEPKRVAVRNAERKLQFATKDLNQAEIELAEKQKALDEMKAKFDQAMAEKQRLQADADLCRLKMESATQLISGLSEEKDRWTLSSKRFVRTRAELLGNVAVGSAFLSYAGVFNREFRMRMMEELVEDLKMREIPISDELDMVRFLVEESEVDEWTLQQLPTDTHSVQNGIITTRARRYPLLIDPQGQGHAWIMEREHKEQLIVTQCQEKNFKTLLEMALSQGRPLLIENVGETLDPLLTNILEKNFSRSGRILSVEVGDKEVEVASGFRLYLTSRLSNPHYSPEIAAKTMIVDFTVTHAGLEDQLLGRVILKERHELEKRRQDLLEEITSNKRKVKELEDNLLLRLTEVSGSLVDDRDLVGVLASTKSTAMEAAEKLSVASETQRKISTAREEFRSVAVRGSILYFLVAEMALVNVMYSTSLSQYLRLFEAALDHSEGSLLTNKRIHNIEEYLTRSVYEYVARGLFVEHKFLFSLQLALKIGLKAGHIDMMEYNTFLRGGSALDIASAPLKPCSWIPDVSWLNLVALSSLPTFYGILENVKEEEKKWAKWYSLDAPEKAPLPGPYRELDDFRRLLLVRSWCEDRAIIAAQEYVSDRLGEFYVHAPPVNLEAAWEESDPRTPLVCLISPGSDPSASISTLSKKMKQVSHEVSMGQGQEVPAGRALKLAMSRGGWVVLQNCHLAPVFMDELVGMITMAPKVHDGFRLWITTEPSPEFSIPLLQMSIKLTSQPPRGVQRSLLRTFDTVGQDLLDSVDMPQWHALMYTTVYLHTVLQERRRFGTLGWNIPYEFNSSDLTTSLQFLQNHLWYECDRKRGISWKAVIYILTEVMYGGRVTDDHDRRLLTTYGRRWLNDRIFEDGFDFDSGISAYAIPGVSTVKEYRDRIVAMPEATPELFGLHANADVSFRTKEARAVLETLVSVQPKEVTDGGETREQVVDRRCEEYLEKLPADFSRDYVEQQLSEMGEIAPLAIFLGQEIEQMQRVMTCLRKMLQNLRLAIQGTIVMSEDLLTSFDAIYDAVPPPLLVKVSWDASTLGFWFTSFEKRVKQYVSWLANQNMTTFWLAGFFNPQGFLTAVRLKETGAHAGWALDDVVLHSEVLTGRVDVGQPIEDGVYLTGLHLEGAGYHRTRGIVPSQSKVLYHEIPVLHVRAMLEKSSRHLLLGETSKRGARKKEIYSCPVYRTPQRSAETLVFTADLVSEHSADKWILAGVALLCAKE